VINSYITSFFGLFGCIKTLTGLQISITKLSSDLVLLIPLPLEPDETQVWVEFNVVEVVSLKSSNSPIST
jgi:hypothetical protein